MCVLGSCQHVGGVVAWTYCFVGSQGLTGKCLVVCAAVCIMFQQVVRLGGTAAPDAGVSYLLNTCEETLADPGRP